MRNPNVCAVDMLTTVLTSSIFEYILFQTMTVHWNDDDDDDDDGTGHFQKIPLENGTAGTTTLATATLAT